MPPRSTPPFRGSIYPQNDSATYRDVLMFEERLKTTALSLQRRKSRYQFFLLQLLAAISFLLWEVLLPPQASFLVVPHRMVLQWVLPEVYSQDPEPRLHPYFASGLLFVSVTTLLLFFASGMYSEKIAYANKYVPHANRALRSFNMVLNVRKPPLRSKFMWNPLKFFFPRPHEVLPTPSLRVVSRSPSPTRSPRSRSSSTSRPMASLPPTTNPRGELIFSSRVDKNFRESYERYRATFERKREERQMAERRQTWWGKLVYREKEPSPSPGSAGLGPGIPVRSGSASSSRGRGGGQSRSGTPPMIAAGGIMIKQRDRSGSPIRQGSGVQQRSETPPSPGGPQRQASGTVRDRGLRRDRDSSEGNMRTLALSRSFEYGQTHRRESFE